MAITLHSFRRYRTIGIVIALSLAVILLGLKVLKGDPEVQREGVFLSPSGESSLLVRHVLYGDRLFVAMPRVDVLLKAKGFKEKALFSLDDEGAVEVRGKWLGEKVLEVQRIGQAVVMRSPESVDGVTLSYVSAAR